MLISINFNLNRYMQKQRHVSIFRHFFDSL